MHNHCVYVITWYTLVAVCKTDAYSYNTSALWSSPKWLALRIGPPTFRCPGAAPGKRIDLKFSGNMSSLVLGKVRKFQPRSSSLFGDIPEKPEGWMKTTPPATNRVKPCPYMGEGATSFFLVRATSFKPAVRNLESCQSSFRMFPENCKFMWPQVSAETWLHFRGHVTCVTKEWHQARPAQLHPHNGRADDISQSLQVALLSCRKRKHVCFDLTKWGQEVT